MEIIIVVFGGGDDGAIIICSTEAAAAAGGICAYFTGDVGIFIRGIGDVAMGGFITRRTCEAAVGGRFRTAITGIGSGMFSHFTHSIHIIVGGVINRIFIVAGRRAGA